MHPQLKPIWSGLQNFVFGCLWTVEDAGIKPTHAQGDHAKSNQERPIRDSNQGPLCCVI